MSVWGLSADSRTLWEDPGGLVLGDEVVVVVGAEVFGDGKRATTNQSTSRIQAQTTRFTHALPRPRRLQAVYLCILWSYIAVTADFDICVKI